MQGHFLDMQFDQSVKLHCTLSLSQITPQVSVSSLQLWYGQQIASSLLSTLPILVYLSPIGKVPDTAASTSIGLPSTSSKSDVINEHLEKSCI